MVASDHPVRRYAHLHRCAEGTHSRLADGSTLCWRTPQDVWTYALDGELEGQPVPRLLARRWGTGDPGEFWPRWVVAEVVAKLTDTPVLVLAARGAVPVPAGLEVVLAREDDVVVARGRRLTSP